VIAWLDGALVAADAAHISISDRGFTVGDGVFETLRTYGRRPFGVDHHLERLSRSAAVMDIDLPPPATIGAAIDATVEANPPGEYRIRLTVTAGSGPAGTKRGDGPPTVLVTVGPLPAVAPVAAVAVCPWTRNPDDPLAGVKSTSYAGNVRALAWAASHGADEAIFLTTDGHVSEGSGSNVFVLIDGVLVTPPLSSGCLAGVTRALVIGACVDAGIPVLERPMPAAELRSADEVFLTSTTREVQPVAAVDDRSLGGNGSVTAAASVALGETIGRHLHP
jgi:branched-chain amino acid aminotransferase